MKVDEVDLEVVPDGSLLIGDRWVDSTSAGTAVHLNPSNGEPLGSFPPISPGQALVVAFYR